MRQDAWIRTCDGVRTKAARAAAAVLLTSRGRSQPQASYLEQSSFEVTLPPESTAVPRATKFTGRCNVGLGRPGARLEALPPPVASHPREGPSSDGIRDGIDNEVGGAASSSFRVPRPRPGLSLLMVYQCTRTRGRILLSSTVSSRCWQCTRVRPCSEARLS